MRTEGKEGGSDLDCPTAFWFKVPQTDDLGTKLDG